MSQRVRCPHCGALNSESAQFCSQCLQRYDPSTALPEDSQGAQEEEVLGQQPAMATAAAGVTGGFAGGVTAPPGERPWMNPRRTRQALPEMKREDPGERFGNWKWRHLLLIGVLAWVIPESITLALAEEVPFKSFLDAALMIQIFGYLMAVGALVLIVKFAHKGDWSSLGLKLSDENRNEWIKGALFGFGLILVWLPIGFAIGQGQPRFDLLVSSLIGETSTGGLLLAAVVLVFGAPIVEEIYYRGILWAKIAKRSTGTAIFVTSMVFVASHGAIFIPPLLLLAFGLAFKRTHRSLWYTIGAHGAWNLVVMGLAAYMLLGPAFVISPEGGSYSVRHSADWQRVKDAESALEAPRVNGVIDFALAGPSGSLIEVGRFDVKANLPSDEMVLTDLIDRLHSVFPSEFQPVKGDPKISEVIFPGYVSAYEADLKFVEPVTKAELVMTTVVVRHPDIEQAVVFNFTCGKEVCEVGADDFKVLMQSAKWK